MTTAFTSGALRLALLARRSFASSGSGHRPLSPLATELLLARRRQSQHERDSKAAEWREALGGVAHACGVEEDDQADAGRWQAAAAALQQAAAASPPAAAHLFSGDAAADAAELRALLALMARSSSSSPAKDDDGARLRRASAALVPAVAAAPAMLLEAGGARRAAEVLAALRTRAELSPGQALEAVERCPSLLGFSPDRVRDNLLFLLGASAASAAASAAAEAGPALPAIIAHGAPAALGRPPPALRATWEYLVGGGPAFEPGEDFKLWPGALERDAGELGRQWALAERVGVRLLRPAAAAAAAAVAAAAAGPAPSSWRQKGEAPARAWVETTPDALGRALGLRVGEAQALLGAVAAAS